MTLSANSVWRKKTSSVGNALKLNNNWENVYANCTHFYQGRDNCSCLKRIAPVDVLVGSVRTNETYILCTLHSHWKTFFSQSEVGVMLVWRMIHYSFAMYRSSVSHSCYPDFAVTRDRKLRRALDILMFFFFFANFLRSSFRAFPQWNVDSTNASQGISYARNMSIDIIERFCQRTPGRRQDKYVSRHDDRASFIIQRVEKARRRRRHPPSSACISIADKPTHRWARVMRALLWRLGPFPRECSICPTVDPCAEEVIRIPKINPSKLRNSLAKVTRGRRGEGNLRCARMQLTCLANKLLIREKKNDKTKNPNK